MVDKKGALLRKLINKRNEVRAAEEVWKTYKAEFDEMAMQMLDMLEADDATGTNNDAGSCSIVSTTVAQVTDWDKFYRYVHKHKAFYLLQRRVADVAYRHEQDNRGKRLIPGVQPFTRRRLNLRVGTKS